MNRLIVECPYCTFEHTILVSDVNTDYEQICCSCGEKFILILSGGKIHILKAIDSE